MNEKIIFGGGCFWCTEAIFKRLKGVLSVTPGYAGGTVENPSYEEVCAGNTNHVEVIEIEFNKNTIPLKVLIEIFFHTHNPTEIDRQGDDVGTQYRSVIFYFNDEQKNIANKVMGEIKKSGLYENNITTTVEPYINFFNAEEYHKNYYDNNKNNFYCSAIISPKVQKLLNEYSAIIKDEYIN
ncbi:MAG: peptide-methionine (S)-S-oxide reductase MsrA [Patescibacteria group bacterium]